MWTGIIEKHGFRPKIFLGQTSCTMLCRCARKMMGCDRHKFELEADCLVHHLELENPGCRLGNSKLLKLLMLII